MPAQPKVDPVELIRAYETRDPAKETIDDLASRFGISKGRVYQILRERDVPTRSARVETIDSLTQEIVDSLVVRHFDLLMEDLVQARKELADARADIERLKEDLSVERRRSEVHHTPESLEGGG